MDLCPSIRAKFDGFPSDEKNSFPSINDPPDYEVVPCFKLQSSIFLKKSIFVQLSTKLTGGKSSWWIRTNRVCKGSHHSYLPWKGLGCF